LEDRGIENILNGCSRIGMEGMDWIDLARVIDRRQAVVNAVMNILVA
jgi:hypothetical protein